MKQLVINILARQAKRLIKKIEPEIIAVTGSVGKSSTKDAIAAVLRMRFQVLKSPQNYNTEIGLPCAILGLKSQKKSVFGWAWAMLQGFWRSNFQSQYLPKLLVLEFGADRPGDIAKLSAIAPAQIGVMTAIGESHATAYNSIDDIFKEKLTLIAGLPKAGVAILNRDDELVWSMREFTQARVVSFGNDSVAEVQAHDLALKFSYSGGSECAISFKLEYAGNSVPVFLSGTLSRVAVNAALAAAAVGIVKGLNLSEIAEGLRDFVPPAGRMRCLAGIKRTLLIDDTYNAAPKSVLAGLNSVAAINFLGHERKIAVLGDMLELGKYSDSGHEAVGQAVAANNFDLAVFVGPNMALAQRAALACGMSEDKIMHFANTREAGLLVQEKIKSGDVVFVKGSRAMKMETIVQELMAEPLRAKELLVARNDSGPIV